MVSKLVKIEKQLWNAVSSRKLVLSSGGVDNFLHAKWTSEQKRLWTTEQLLLRLLVWSLFGLAWWWSCDLAWWRQAGWWERIRTCGNPSWLVAKGCRTNSFLQNCWWESSPKILHQGVPRIWSHVLSWGANNASRIAYRLRWIYCSSRQVVQWKRWKRKMCDRNASRTNFLSIWLLRDLSPYTT